MQYTIRSINIGSAFKFGSIVGMVIGLPPGIFWGFFLRYIVNGMRVWLESWLALDLPILGQVSLLDALHLRDFLALLQQLDDRSLLFVITVTLSVMVGGGIILGVLIALGAVVYNLVAGISGGLTVQADMLNGAPVTAPALAAMRVGQVSAYPLPGQPAVPHQSTVPIPAAELGGNNWLIATAGQQRWMVPSGFTRIGSAPGNDVVLPGLAGKHAEIRWEDGRHILHDFSNGQTWINGRQINAPNMLKSGFQIRLGAHELLFE